MNEGKGDGPDGAMRQVICAQLMASIAVHEQMLADDLLLGQLESLARSCIDALQKGGKVVFAGNGGSFADAQHLSAELTSRFRVDRAPLPSLALGTNGSAISAIGNDYGFPQVFARELRAVGRPGDVFIPISTSGSSPNILAAVDVAKELNILTVALTGLSGGRLEERCKCICAPSEETARIQECHVLIGHILCGLVEASCFPGGTNV